MSESNARYADLLKEHMRTEQELKIWKAIAFFDAALSREPLISFIDPDDEVVVQDKCMSDKQSSSAHVKTIETLTSTVHGMTEQVVATPPAPPHHPTPPSLCLFFLLLLFLLLLFLLPFLRLPSMSFPVFPPNYPPLFRFAHSSRGVDLQVEVSRAQRTASTARPSAGGCKPRTRAVRRWGGAET